MPLSTLFFFFVFLQVCPSFEQFLSLDSNSAGVFFLSLDYDFCHILHKFSIGDATHRDAFLRCKHLGKDLMIRLKGQYSLLFITLLFIYYYYYLSEWNI